MNLFINALNWMLSASNILDKIMWERASDLLPNPFLLEAKDMGIIITNKVIIINHVFTLQEPNCLAFQIKVFILFLFNWNIDINTYFDINPQYSKG